MRHEPRPLLPSQKAVWLKDRKNGLYTAFGSRRLTEIAYQAQNNEIEPFLYWAFKSFKNHSRPPSSLPTNTSPLSLFSVLPLPPFSFLILLRFNETTKRPTQIGNSSDDRLSLYLSNAQAQTTKHPSFLTRPYSLLSQFFSLILFGSVSISSNRLISSRITLASGQSALLY